MVSNVGNGGWGDIDQPMQVNPLVREQGLAAIRERVNKPIAGQVMSSSGVADLPKADMITEGINNAMAAHKADFWSKIKLTISSLFSTGSIATTVLIVLGVIVTGLAMATPVGWALAGLALVVSLISLYKSYKKDKSAEFADKYLAETWGKLNNHLNMIDPLRRDIPAAAPVKQMMEALRRVGEAHRNIDTMQLEEISGQYHDYLIRLTLSGIGIRS